MSSTTRFKLDLKCLVFGGPDGNKAYALVDRAAPVLVQALIPASDPRLLTWSFITAGWSIADSSYLDGDTASCIMNKAGEVIALGSWEDVRGPDHHYSRGFVYNPYNPLPEVERRFTSNALWMQLNMAANINNTESEWSQIIIDTGADDNSAREVALTGTHLLIRKLHATGSTTRELVGLGGWTLYSDNFLYIFTAYGNFGFAATTLVRIPFSPNATIPSQLLAGPPTGTTSIDTSSTNYNCSWDKTFLTAALDDKFYLLCQKDFGFGYSMNLYVYDNKTGTQNSKLRAPVTVAGIDESITVRLNTGAVDDGRDSLRGTYSRLGVWRSGSLGRGGIPNASIPTATEVKQI
ncbi:hypothetical protein BGZ70_006778 [Mortierella alpina]|uniref:Uncharacterized protein n=1 Tax=Mortierella alpina TaxID=64518 RepID=A0A9P6J7J1_MORAP|nr:hypothetical protein BGZ70_006778 [Mortierella alpina]